MSDAPKTYRIALLGNPNTGKSTLFSALVGTRQRVGNYPGVTVEKTSGNFTRGQVSFEAIDLPGLYSLSPKSLDEMVAVEVLLGDQLDASVSTGKGHCKEAGHGRRHRRRGRFLSKGPTNDGMPHPDAVIFVADATNLRRSLYLLSQLNEWNIPTVIALGKVDLADREGLRIDIQQLSERLGLPVVPVQPVRREGIDQLSAALASLLESEEVPEGDVVTGTPATPDTHACTGCSTGCQAASTSDKALPCPAPNFPDPLHEEVETLRDAFREKGLRTSRRLMRRLLLDPSGRIARRIAADDPDRAEALIEVSRQSLAMQGIAVPAIETEIRYAWIDELLTPVLTHPESPGRSISDRIDRWLTSRVGGIIFFLVLMLMMFQAVMVWSAPVTGWLEELVGVATKLVNNNMADGWLRSLLADGLLAGVGGVLTFLPPIAALFIFLAILEDCGYMARAAFLMDRIMSRVGLSGKAFIPLLSSLACAVPGILATRVIEDRRDRLTTILVAPLMTCSARLPVYTMLIAAFVPAHYYLGGLIGLQALVMIGLYALGVVTTVLAALIFKRTILKGRPTPLLLELPSYRVPSLRMVLHRVWERVRSFLLGAGTIIVAATVLVWALLYFPQGSMPGDSPTEATPTARASADSAKVESVETAEPQGVNQSYLARMGRTIEPAVRPLGWDWRIGCSVLASLPAREIVVASMGVMFGAPELEEAEGEEAVKTGSRVFREAKWEGTDRPLFTLATALSLLVFYALCCQCAATLAAIYRETHTWRWPVFTFAYMTVLAYVGALVTYQVGSLWW